MIRKSKILKEKQQEFLTCNLFIMFLLSWGCTGFDRVVEGQIKRDVVSATLKTEKSLNANNNNNVRLAVAA